jgi:hypothetical protein
VERDGDRSPQGTRCCGEPRFPDPRTGILIRDDAQLAEQLAYVVPLGIPHSHFLGGPNHWTDLDQDKALAWNREQRKQCATCKTRKDEWESDPDRYVGNIERCPGCERLEQEQENVQQMKGAKGLKIGLVPKEMAMMDAELVGG